MTGCCCIGWRWRHALESWINIPSRAWCGNSTPYTQVSLIKLPSARRLKPLRGAAAL